MHQSLNDRAGGCAARHHDNTARCECAPVKESMIASADVLNCSNSMMVSSSTTTSSATAGTPVVNDDAATDPGGAFHAPPKSVVKQSMEEGTVSEATPKKAPGATMSSGSTTTVTTTTTTATTIAVAAPHSHNRLRMVTRPAAAASHSTSAMRDSATRDGAAKQSRDGSALLSDESESSAISTLTPHGAALHVASSSAVTQPVGPTTASMAPPHPPHCVSMPSEPHGVTESLEPVCVHETSALQSPADPARLYAIRQIVASTCQSILRLVRPRHDAGRWTEDSALSTSCSSDHPSTSNTGSLAVYALFFDLHQQATSGVLDRSLSTHESLYFYMDTFGAAVTRPDVNATITALVLDAWSLLVQHGYLTSSRHVQAMAQSLLQCAFAASSLQGVPLTPSSVSSATAAAARLESRPKLQRQSSHTPPPPTSSAPMPAAAGAPLRVERRASSRVSTAATAPHAAAAAWDEAPDEHAVLKLLHLSVQLCVSTALPPTIVTALLDTCWHVRHTAVTASPQLKTVATLSVQDMIRRIFAPDTDNADTSNTETQCAILHRIAQLLVDESSSVVVGTNVTTHAVAPPDKHAVVPLPLPLHCPPDVMAHHGLALLHSILVGPKAAGRVEPSETRPLDVWQSTIVPRVVALAWQTRHVAVWQQCVCLMNQMVHCFQLSNLQYEWEAFVYAAYLRRLDAQSMATVDEQEVVLQSLCELCRVHHPLVHIGAPVNAVELYWNYDCHATSTNLYQRIVVALAHMAHPWVPDDEQPLRKRTASSETANSVDTYTTASSVTDAKGMVPSTAPSTVTTSSTTKPVSSITLNAVAPLNHLNRLALEGILSLVDLMEAQCHDHGAVYRGSSLSNAVATSEADISARRQTKTALHQVALVFNTTSPDKGEWLKVAETEGLIASTTDRKAVGELLHRLPDIVDKQRLGIYLSRGPDASFPFQAEVRLHYTARIDFSGLNFAAALRKYLSKFRLPGEAQCIDRLMESFSKEYFHQQRGSSVFANEDAVYVLAFSTIMLNTDLHNPTIKTEQRMTMEQFVRNNRGINNGKDLPEAYVAELYDQIKDRALQVRATTTDFMKPEMCDFDSAWESVVEKKRESKGELVVLDYSKERQTNRVEKDMILCLTNASVKAIVGIFARSWDDTLVVRTLRGLQQIVKIAAFFELDCVINSVLQALLPHGRGFIVSCIANDQILDDGCASSDDLTLNDAHGEDDNTTQAENDQNFPLSLLCSSDVGDNADVSGSAANRGLLALDSSFVMLRKYSTRISTAWPAFIECLCVLRDARALPVGLSDLDDFADSSGKVLPLSFYARASQKRLDAHHKAQSGKDAAKQKGWLGLRSFFRKGKAESANDSSDDEGVERKGKLSLCARTLLGVAESADVENIVQMGSSQLPDATIRTLLDGLDAYPFENDAPGEQHAVFTLELAARALLSNRERAADLFALFLSKFEGLLVQVTEPDSEILAPFVIERVVVTILRSSIHLYEFPELRPQLRASLQLLHMTLPASFLKVIADRMACGLAIILRASYHFFETYNEWSLVGDMLDVLAQYGTSRVFVFDGIASTVEYAISNASILQEPRKIMDDVSVDVTVDEDDDRPKLSLEGCSSLSRILTRFVLGFYQGDVSLTVPAMLCLEKVYRRKVEILLHAQAAKDGKEVSESDLISLVPDKDFWQNVAVAVYSVCRSPDPDTSNEGLQCYLRIVLRTSVDEIPEEKWVAILYLMVNKQPTTTAEVSRGNTFAILGHLLTRLLPGLSHLAEQREDLEELVSQYAALAEQNLQQGRRGDLFEKTLQTLTYLSNLVISDDWTGDKEFSAWMNEVLLKELEQAGDGGRLVTTNNPEDLDDVSEISDSVAEDDDNDLMGSRR